MTNQLEKSQLEWLDRVLALAQEVVLRAPSTFHGGIPTLGGTVRQHEGHGRALRHPHGSERTGQGSRRCLVNEGRYIAMRPVPAPVGPSNG